VAILAHVMLDMTLWAKQLAWTLMNVLTPIHLVIKTVRTMLEATFVAALLDIHWWMPPRVKMSMNVP
jgi:hypothetical protein